MVWRSAFAPKHCSGLGHLPVKHITEVNWSNDHKVAPLIAEHFTPAALASKPGVVGQYVVVRRAAT